MNKRIKKLWIKALRSGKYKQGRNQLRINGRHCCLGVLEDLAVKAKVRKSFPTHNAVLTDDVIKWSGLPDSSPVAGRKCLASLNDAGVPFTAIADRIEKYL